MLASTNASSSLNSSPNETDWSSGVRARVVIPVRASSSTPNGFINSSSALTRSGLAHNSTTQLNSAMSAMLPPKSCTTFVRWSRLAWRIRSHSERCNFVRVLWPGVTVLPSWKATSSAKYSGPSSEILANRISRFIDGAVV